MRRKPGSGNSGRSGGHDDARDSIQDGGDVAEDGEQAVENWSVRPKVSIIIRTISAQTMIDLPVRDSRKDEEGAADGGGKSHQTRGEQHSCTEIEVLGFPCNSIVEGYYLIIPEDKELGP